MANGDDTGTVQLGGPTPTPLPDQYDPLDDKPVWGNIDDEFDAEGLAERIRMLDANPNFIRMPNNQPTWWNPARGRYYVRIDPMAKKLGNPDATGEDDTAFVWTQIGSTPPPDDMSPLTVWPPLTERQDTWGGNSRIEVDISKADTRLNAIKVQTQSIYEAEEDRLLTKYLNDGDADAFHKDLWRLSGKGEPPEEVFTVPGIIAGFYKAGTDEDDAKALSLQKKWNAITPYERASLDQRSKEFAYTKKQDSIGNLLSFAEFNRLVENDQFNQWMGQQELGLAQTTQRNLQTQRTFENELARDYYDLSDDHFQQTYGLSKNQFLAGENQREFENRFAQDQFNAQQEQLQFNNQQALTDQAFRATELGLDLLNSPGDLFTFLTRLRGDQGSLPFQQGGQAIPRTFPFTFNQAIPPQPFGLRDMNWAPPGYDWGREDYQQPGVPWSPDSPPRYDPETGERLVNPFDMPDLVTPIPPSSPSRLLPPSSVEVPPPLGIYDDPFYLEDNIGGTAPTTMPIPTSEAVAPPSGGDDQAVLNIAPDYGARTPMGGTIAQAGMINPTAQTSPSQQLGFGGTGTRTVTPSGMPMTTLQPFGLPTSTVGPLPEQGLSQAFLGMPPTGRRTLASLGAPPALSYQSMSRLTPTERAIRLSEAKAQGFSEQDFLEEDRRHQMSPRTGGGRARFVPGRFRG